MLEKAKKRDGRIVDFNKQKVVDAIFKAAQAVGGQDYDTAEKLADSVIEYLENVIVTPIPDVEQIQDAVEKILIEAGHAKTAKAYILYRADRTKIREKNTKLMDIYKDIAFVDSEQADLKRENANIDGDKPMGTMLSMALKRQSSLTKCLC